MRISRKQQRMIITSFLAVFFLLYLFLTTNLSKLPQTLSSAQISSIFLGLILFLFSLIAKLYRWHILFPGERSFFKQLPVYTSAYASATAFPFNTGDLIAMEIMTEWSDSEFGSSAAVVVFSRFIDLCCLLSLVGLSIYVLMPDQKLQIFFWAFLFLIFLGIAIIFSQNAMTTLNHLLIRITSKISPSLSLKLEQVLVSQLNNYFGTLFSIWYEKKQAVMILVLTLTKWFAEILATMVVVSAFETNFSLENAIVLVSIDLFVGITTQTPTGLGTGTTAVIFVLEEYGMTRELAVAVEIVRYVVSVGFTLILGVLAALFLRFHPNNSYFNRGSNKDIENQLKPNKT
ncbi:MAG: YbhN family protein [Promethearchaeota archaeon]